MNTKREGYYLDDRIPLCAFYPFSINPRRDCIRTVDNKKKEKEGGGESVWSETGALCVQSALPPELPAHEENTNFRFSLTPAHELRA